VQQGLAALAAETGMVLCAGSFPELDGGRLYNTAVVYGPAGDLLLRHRKAHLYGVEPGAFRPGGAVVTAAAAGAMLWPSATGAPALSAPLPPPRTEGTP